MRIGLISDSYEPYISGVTASIKMLAKGLREMGHEVFIFTITYKDLTEEQKNDPFVIRFKGFSVPFKGLRKFKRIPFVNRHIKVIEKYNLDVLHIHSTSSMGLLGLRASKRLNIPIVFTAHTIYEQYLHFVSKILPKIFPRTFRGFIKALMRKYINNSNITIVPSNKMKQLMLSYGIEKDYQIVPTGLNLDIFKKENYSQTQVNKLKEQVSISKDDFICLYVGRISLEKNIDFLLEAFKEIKEDKMKFVIVGGGPNIEFYKEVVNKNNLDNKVYFTGSVPWEQIGLYYQLGDCFINASTTETQGLTYIEALAASLPLIAKEDDVLKNVLINGFNGYIFNTKEELITNIMKIKDSEDLAKQISKNAVKSIQKYHYSSYAQTALKLYEQIVDKQTNN